MIVNNFHHPLIEEFHLFYYELLRAKELALRSHYHKENLEKLHDEQGDQNAQKAEVHSNASVYNAALLIQDKFLSFFEEQSKKLGFLNNRLAFENTQEAQYLMVSLVDEVFINLDWQGASFWKDSTLEARLFFTQVSGEVIFNRIDDLLRLNNQSKKELGCLYLMILGLGFRGGYRGEGDSKKIDHYREQLFSFIHHVPANLLYPGRDKLFHDLYRFTVTNHKVTMLPTVSKWFKISGFILLFYLFITFVFWQDLTKSMNKTLQDLKSITPQSHHSTV
jgi:type VI secretion system protein ImpK